MFMRNLQRFALAAALVAGFALVGCSKKVAKATPPPPPPPAAPTATLAASPDVVKQGQATQLTWQTTNATDVTIAGLGTLAASGSRTVVPSGSTTYTLVAKGPGGTQDASARVTVNPVAAQITPAPEPTEQELFAKNIKDVFFDFDKYSVRPDEVPVAQNNASFLAQHPDIKVMVEGHCDDRGSEEYNLALGASRANSLKQALQRQGVNASRIMTTSYGKEHPFCTQDNEQCWQENRRDHFVFQQ
ncbi:MAG TPA: peptidoglycan-associated lipoprotein Pal [Terriglobales bacterium]|nr:peptidoglycan-associated lipoprotein Pal [Terriglobales bacterium]